MPEDTHEAKPHRVGIGHSSNVSFEEALRDAIHLMDPLPGSDFVRVKVTAIELTRGGIMNTYDLCVEVMEI